MPVSLCVFLCQILCSSPSMKLQHKNKNWMAHSSIIECDTALFWTKISIASRNGSFYALQSPFCSPHCSITIQTNINPREHTRVHTRAHTEVIPQIPSLTANLSPPPHQPALLSNGSVMPSLTCSLLVCKSHTRTHTHTNLVIFWERLAVIHTPSESHVNDARRHFKITLATWIIVGTWIKN